MSEPLQKRTFLPFIFRKLSILLAVGFSDVSSKTIVHLNDA